MRFDFINAPVVKKFDPRRHFPDFETLAQAKKRRRKYIALLLADPDPRAQKLGKRLGRCHLKLRPCMSPACPVCARRFRAWWASKIYSLMADSGDQWTVLSIVPIAQRFSVGKLSKFRLRAAKDRLRKQLERSSIKGVEVVGAIDVCLQELEDGRFVWSLHFYLATHAPRKRARNALRRYYDCDRDTRKPVVAKRVGSTALDQLQ